MKLWTVGLVVALPDDVFPDDNADIATCVEKGTWQYALVLPGYQPDQAFRSAEPGDWDTDQPGQGYKGQVDTASSASRQHYIDTGYYLPTDDGIADAAFDARHPIR